MTEQETLNHTVLNKNVSVSLDKSIKKKEHKKAINYYVDLIINIISENTLGNLIEGQSIQINSLEFLDGIDITTYLELYYDEDDDTYNLSLQIYDKLYFISLYCEHLYTETNLIDFIKKKNLKKVFKNALKIFKSLKYCHIRNSFNKDDYIILYDGKYLNEKNINTCSICNIKTSCKTVCNHFICLICVSQIKNSLCPLCRKPLLF